MRIPSSRSHSRDQPGRGAVRTERLAGVAPASSQPPAAQEPHLANITQLTVDGENAEAYFSFDGRRLIFQSTHGGAACDQIYTMNTDGSALTRVSSGQGADHLQLLLPRRTAHPVRLDVQGRRRVPTQARLLTRLRVARLRHLRHLPRQPDGSGIEPLTTTPGYDAEATIAKDGTIVFTSVRDGDMEIYSMNPDGSGVTRLTHRPGPDGGPFFSPDGSQIVFRGRGLQPGKELDEYQLLLKESLWRPTSLEIYVMNRDGSNVRQVTALHGASFAPYWYPDGKRIIFASNHQDPRGRDFDLWAINVDGTNLERITHNPTFDGFPMFSPDGTKLVFASNRKNAHEGDTNVFIADWHP